MNKITVVPAHIASQMHQRAKRLAEADERTAEQTEHIARALTEAWAEGVQYEMQIVKETIQQRFDAVEEENR